MKRYLIAHGETILCFSLCILLAVIAVVAYFWMFPSE